ncbi:MAG: methionine--tRNA ligase subunit beta [Planctomycetes bacterium]|nr:methionine--tRNA ligase subunit beta [Planctomycetota bacterium]
MSENEAAPTPENTETKPQEEAAPEGVKFCTYDDFCKIDLRIAEVTQAENHPNADKLLRLQLKVGDRTKQICAGVKAWYEPESLVGKRIVIVDNLEPRKLRGEVSEGMLLAARDEATGDLTLITTDKPDFASGCTVG